MKGALTVLGRLDGRGVAARLVDGRLQELRLDSGPDAPEALFRGRLGRPAKGMGGAFVDLPDGRSGFLRQTAGLRPGQSLVLQVSGVAEPGKALPLTARLLLKGRHAICTPGAPGLNVSRRLRDAAERERLTALAADAMAAAPPDTGLILRSAAAGAGAEALTAEIAALLAQAGALAAAAAGPPALLQPAPDAHAIARRDWPDGPVQEGAAALAQHDIPGHIERLCRPAVALPDGAGMMIEPTRALVAVDVNTGADSTPAAGLKANLAAARELPRQLRLRGLGGQVVVDFAPMPRRDRGRLEQTLQAALRADPDGAGTTLAGWTPLGHLELQRRRDRPPLQTLWP